jgi:CheY-like chemotaxis protein
MASKESNGAAVTVATTARAALRHPAAMPADVLISDIGLPEMDGYELLEQIRRQDAMDWGGIPAIALTAFARSVDRRRTLLAGYQAHLPKPIDSVELIATVASFAELVRMRRVWEAEESRA